jgi:hypothetical protein
VSLPAIDGRVSLKPIIILELRELRGVCVCVCVLGGS